MIAEHQTLDEQVRETAQQFPGEVVGLRYSIGHDWNGDPAIFFRVVLTDDASRTETLADITARVREKLFDKLRLRESDYTPYFYFRNESELKKLTDSEWGLLKTC